MKNNELLKSEKKTFITKEAILESLKEVKDIEICEDLEDRLVLLDEGGIVFKTIAYFFNEYIDQHLEERIYIGESNSNLINKENLLHVLKNYLDPNCLLTLDKLWFVESEEDLEALYEYTGDEYALEVIDLENHVGLTWWEKNICIINIARIKEIAQEFSEDEDSINSFSTEFNIGCLTTIIHELRHLMLDTNIILSEEEYPESEAKEDEVEEYCRRVFETYVEGKEKSIIVNLK